MTVSRTLSRGENARPRLTPRPQLAPGWWAPGAYPPPTIPELGTGRAMLPCCNLASGGIDAEREGPNAEEPRGPRIRRRRLGPSPVSEPPTERLASRTSPALATRVASMDLVRGAVMILMAIDHVRVFS